MMAGLAAEADPPKTIMIDATFLKAHRTASSLRVKRGRGRLIGRTKGGPNIKMHAIADAEGRQIRFFLTAGQVSDYTGALALLSNLPKAEWLLAGKGYDADWFREAPHDRGIKPCIPGRSSRDKPVKHDKRRDKWRHRIENLSAVSRTGAALPCATTAAQKCSCRLSRSPPQSRPG